MSKRRGPTPRKDVRHLDGIPGTVTHGFKEQPIVEEPLPRQLLEYYETVGWPAEDILTLRLYKMGPCNIMVGHERAGAKHEKLWHLSISTPSRHPTWDEIKVARYRLLPRDICVGLMLPPPVYYVNVEDQDHVFGLWEITDPRAPWEVR